MLLHHIPLVTFAFNGLQGSNFDLHNKEEPGDIPEKFEDLLQENPTQTLEEFSNGLPAY